MSTDTSGTNQTDPPSTGVEGPLGPQGPDSPQGPGVGCVHKVRRVLKPGGGYAICRKNNKRVTGCKQVSGWRRAVYCLDDQYSFYVPTSSLCDTGGSLSGQTVMYQDACYYVEPAVIQEADIPPDAIRVDDPELDCSPTNCNDPACVESGQCCRSGFAGIISNIVNGADFSGVGSASLGSRPIYGYQFDLSIQASASNVQFVQGWSKTFNLSGTLAAKYQAQELNSCRTDTTIESTSAMSGAATDSLTGDTVNLNFRIDQNDPLTYNLNNTFVDAPISSNIESEEPSGAVSQMNMRIDWKGARNGTTLSFYNNGIWPVTSTANGPAANGYHSLVPWMLPQTGSGNASRLSLSFTRFSAAHPAGLVVAEGIRIGGGADWVPVSQSASVYYTRSQFEVTATMNIDTHMRIGTTVVQDHLLSMTATWRSYLQPSGPCTPANRGVQLPPGFDPETGLPLGNPFLCRGCGQ